MVKFTIDEALQNLEDPFRPKCIKSDKEEDKGEEMSGNLANTFSDAQWQEFCEKYKLHWINIKKGVGLDSEDVYVNYDTCAIVTVKPEPKQISMIYWCDSDEKYHSEYIGLSGSLQDVYAALPHAVFPQKVSALFENFVGDREQKHFFPAPEGDNIVYEELVEQIDYLRTDENKIFVDKVTKLISAKITESTKAAKDIKVKERAVVYRQNVKGDGSYCETTLTVSEIGKTYVKLYTNEGITDSTIYTSRKDFWYNFAKIDDLEGDLSTFLYEILDNVLNPHVIAAIRGEEEWEGEASFTQYETGSNSVSFESETFHIYCSNDSFLDKMYVSLSLVRKHAASSTSSSETIAEGFYTDVLLAAALGKRKLSKQDIELLQQFIEGLRENVIKLGLYIGEIPRIFDEALNNVEQACTLVVEEQPVDDEENIEGEENPEDEEKLKQWTDQAIMSVMGLFD